MERSRNPQCPRCNSLHTVANGTTKGRQRWLCRTCGRTFGATTGTPMAGLKTDIAEIARALLIVLRRGSLRAAEEQTGHKYETIGAWVRRAAAHAEAVTAVLATDLHLTEVEIDAFWSFVRNKGVSGKGAPVPRIKPAVRQSLKVAASGGDA